jgi:hypothetical protein
MLEGKRQRQKVELALFKSCVAQNKPRDMQTIISTSLQRGDTSPPQILQPFLTASKPLKRVPRFHQTTSLKRGANDTGGSENPSALTFDDLVNILCALFTFTFLLLPFRYSAILGTP